MNSAPAPKSVFRFNKLSFKGILDQRISIDLVADGVPQNGGTHITLLMGANGTSKSRIMAACVDCLIELHSRSGTKVKQGAGKHQRKGRPDHGIEGVSVAINDNSLVDVESLSHDPCVGKAKLPGRVIAIANLVRDRFPFASELSDSKDEFYHYLGVRQASNLTTTGALDRIASDAILAIIQDPLRYSAMTSWVRRLFPESELGLVIPRFSDTAINAFLKDPVGFLGHRPPFSLRGEEYTKRRLDEIGDIVDNVAMLRNVLKESRVMGASVDGEWAYGKSDYVISLSGIALMKNIDAERLRETLRKMWQFSLIGRPTVVLKSSRWLEFIQLSSGEQNLIATGLRLFAFARPGSMVFIDEPEVSLNIAWQQRYIELISDAMAFAEGSHLIIASHSPHLISDLKREDATVVVAERNDGVLSFKSHPGAFWGWGAEEIMYKVLGIPSTSNYHFTRELTAVLKLISHKSTDKLTIDAFLSKCDRIDLSDDGSSELRSIIGAVRGYADSITQ